MNSAALSVRKIEAVSSTLAWPWQLPPEKSELVCILSAMARAANLQDARIQIRFVSDAEMARINESCLSCNGPTNVITFPEKDGEPGCIAISLDCLHREALIYGQGPLRYLIRLLAHGFGHIGDLGHGSQLEEIQTACEKAALAALGDCQASLQI